MPCMSCGYGGYWICPVKPANDNPKARKLGPAKLVP